MGVVYAPPLRVDCLVLAGPAAVRQALVEQCVQPCSLSEPADPGARLK
jgi:hypothetical protein